jgi:hypothetical protein
MSYRLDYLNLKKKYVNLKCENMIQKGGTKNKFLPCEIMYYTKSLYLNNEMIDSIAPSVDSSITAKISTYITFNQDPYIFLKNSVTSENSAIKIVHSDMDIGSIIVNNLSSSNGNDKGGNFISSPPYNGSNGYIFCFSGVSQPLITYLTDNCIQPLVQLECSFRVNDQRHIDECMTIMPYGINKFKIWFYDIGQISYTPELIKRLSIKCSTDQTKQSLEEIYNKLQEELKNPDVSDIARERKDTLLAVIRELSNIYTRINNNSSSDADNIYIKKNLNKIMNLFDYDLRVCFNLYYNNEAREKQNLFFAKFGNVDTLHKILKAEQQYNLNIVSNAVFGKPYSPDMPEFVIIPIDITADEQGNFKLDTPSIFNRLWIESPSVCSLIFSNKTTSFSSTYRAEILEILRKEMSLIKSYLNNLEPMVRICDTSKYHYKGDAGGNLHCLVKNLYN